MKTKLSLLTIKVRHGDYEFYSHGIHTTRSRQRLRQSLTHFYGGSGSWDGEVRYFDGGAIAVEIVTIQPITESEAEILRRLNVAA